MPTRLRCTHEMARRLGGESRDFVGGHTCGQFARNAGHPTVPTSMRCSCQYLSDNRVTPADTLGQCQAGTELGTVFGFATRSASACSKSRGPRRCQRSSLAWKGSACHPAPGLQDGVRCAPSGSPQRSARPPRTLAIPDRHNTEVHRTVDPLENRGTPKSCRSDTGRSRRLPVRRSPPGFGTSRALLCSHHHHRIHDDGWHLERLDDGTLRFTGPDGRTLTRPPPPPPRPLPTRPVTSPLDLAAIRQRARALAAERVAS